MREDLQKRIEQSIYVSRKKHWYQRAWGRVVIVVGSVGVLWLVVVGVRVAQYYQDIIRGETIGAEIESLQQQAKLDLLHNGNDPTIGPITAPVVIVAFEDFECPFCLQAQPFLKKILAQYKDEIRFIYKDFPLTSIHPNAQQAAEAGQCAFEQGKFWEYHDELFAHQDQYAESYYRTAARAVGLNLTAFNECFSTGKYRRQISEDVELGRTMGVIGTPTFFINGELFAQGYGEEIDEPFQKAIEYIRDL